MMPIDGQQPIVRRNAYSLVADRVFDLIRDRDLLPGDSLPTEREIAETYEVGRSSVREALRMLESRGLIESRGTAPFVVADYTNSLNASFRFLAVLDSSTLREVQELRRILELEVAALAAERRSGSDLAALAGTLDEMKRALAAAEPGASRKSFIDADVDFHLQIARAARNTFAIRIMHAIRALLEWALESLYERAGTAEETLRRHEAILGAIEAGDGETARREMGRHLDRVEVALADLGDQPVAPTLRPGSG